jgi:hypothetical protein
MTPIVEASIRMLQAAELMAGTVGGNTPLRDTGFEVLPPFTEAIERLTPLLDRLVLEGVSVNVQQLNRQNRQRISLSNALRPL